MSVKTGGDAYSPPNVCLEALIAARAREERPSEGEKKLPLFPLAAKVSAADEDSG